MSGPGLELPPGDPRLLVLRHLRPPAFLLLSLGMLNLLFCALFVAALAFGLRMPWTPAEVSAEPAQVLTPSLVAVVVLSLLWAGLSIWGALHALALRRYGLAILGAIAAMVPPSLTCSVGLPIGIWMLVVLNKQGVKSAFSGK
ncbi:MAG TPA: hypothetical protein VFO83_02220 [Aggregicoccus sp.]|nr:hypothetical protein [Aggregicoccus sp.]